ncbi:MAG: HlyD family efflux transporter periplasmic adaptor subunit [Ruminococcus sp.]|nr:HlyD family efflux transporter periplasmic adaptor subunit [Ruminococcus sp.]
MGTERGARENRKKKRGMGIWMKKHKKLCVLSAILLIVAVAAGVIGIRVNRAMEELERELNRPDTAKVERRTLVESVSTTGTFQAAYESNITSEVTNTTVQGVYVKLGDRVTAGDVICVLDTTELEEDLADARKDLADSEKSSREDMERAQRQLDDATRTRDESTSDLDRSINDAQQNWQEAQADRIELENRLAEVESQMEQLKASYESEEGDESQKGSYMDSPSYAPLNEQLISLPGQISTAQRAEERAKNNYDSAVADRENRLRRINDTYQSAVDNYNAAVDRNQDASKREREQVADLEERISAATVKTPIDGIVTDLGATLWADYNGGSLAVIKNTDTLRVEADIDEYDVNKIQIGQEVVIRSNATGDVELTGIVSSVAPAASGSETSNSSVGSIGGLDLGELNEMSGGGLGGGSSDGVVYPILIDVAVPGAEVRLGMTAKLSIILSKQENVLSVPFDAVQDDGDGGLFVEEVTGKDEEGEYTTRKISVTKGVESDYYVEIGGSDVKEGMEIIVPKTESKSIFEMMQEAGVAGGM